MIHSMMASINASWENWGTKVEADVSGGVAAVTIPLACQNCFAGFVPFPLINTLSRLQAMTHNLRCSLRRWWRRGVVPVLIWYVLSLAFFSLLPALTVRISTNERCGHWQLTSKIYRYGDHLLPCKRARYHQHYDCLVELMAVKWMIELESAMAMIVMRKVEMAMVGWLMVLQSGQTGMSLLHFDAGQG